ncbi:MAG: C1 family peptidase [Clostridia bacterium]
MSKAISIEQLETLRAGFFSDGENLLRMNAAMKMGVSDAAESRAEDVENPMIFSVELTSGEVTDQKSSGRCWLFAGLNTMRYQIMRKLNLETFELSQNHMMFYDKLEKANYFLESVLSTMDQPLDSPLMRHLLASPVQDGGQWDMFTALVEKYGCVPRAIMPETFHSANTSKMNELLTCKLREDALLLREAGTGASSLKESMVAEIYRMLSICLGAPPTRFTFEYRDKDKQFFRDEDLTPKAFYEKYVGQTLADYVPVINAPTQDKPYNRTYTVKYLGNVVGGRPIKYLNLPSKDLKALAIAQLQDESPVWFGCDVGKMHQRDRGIMGTHTFDYEALLGVRFGMDKAARLNSCESVLTHAMVFLGVNLTSDGRPNRWKVENSWSKERGQDGYYVMTDAWFDEYTYQVVVNKKYLTPAQLDAFAQEPIALEPWDPFGSLA